MFLFSWLSAKQEGFDRLIVHSSEMVIECGILTELYEQWKVNCTEKILPYGYFIQQKSNVKWPSELKVAPLSKTENCPPSLELWHGQNKSTLRIDYDKPIPSLYTNTFLWVTELEETL